MGGRGSRGRYLSIFIPQFKIDRVLVKKHFERWFNPSKEISRITQPVEISYQYSRTTQKSQPARENIGITEAVSLKTTTNLVSEISELGLELKQRAKEIDKKSL